MIHWPYWFVSSKHLLIFVASMLCFTFFYLKSPIERTLLLTPKYLGPIGFIYSSNSILTADFCSYLVSCCCYFYAIYFMLPGAIFVYCFFLFITLSCNFRDCSPPLISVEMIIQPCHLSHLRLMMCFLPCALFRSSYFSFTHLESPFVMKEV